MEDPPTLSSGGHADPERAESDSYSRFLEISVPRNLGSSKTEFRIQVWHSVEVRSHTTPVGGITKLIWTAHGRTAP